MFKKHFFKILTGICISITFIWLTLQQIDIKRSFELIAGVKYFALIPGVLVYVFTYILRSMRYYYILLPLKKTKVFDNFPYTVIGFFANNIVPLRFGELIRAKIMSERLCVSCSSVLATIVIERLFDVITFVLFFFLIVTVISFPEFIKKSFYILTLVFSIFSLILYIMLTHKNKVLKVLSKMPIPSVVESLITVFFNRFTCGLAVLKKPFILIKSFIFSGVLWITEALFVVIVAYACGIHISILGGIFTVIIIGVGSIIPTVPGYFGTFEFIGVLALSALSVNKDLSFICIAICHLLQFVIIFILGCVCVLKTKITFSDLFKFSKDSE